MLSGSHKMCGPSGLVAEQQRLEWVPTPRSLQCLLPANAPTVHGDSIRSLKSVMPLFQTAEAQTLKATMSSVVLADKEDAHLGLWAEPQERENCSCRNSEAF